MQPLAVALPAPRCSHIVPPMHDVPAADPSPTPRRLADLWRDARAAALIGSLSHAEVGLDLPDPARVAPRSDAMLEGIAHPAVLEVGVPATLTLLALGIWKMGWDAFWPQAMQPRVLFVVFLTIMPVLLAGAGRSLLPRRYARLAREEYNRALWRKAAELETPSTARTDA